MADNYELSNVQNFSISHRSNFQNQHSGMPEIVGNVIMTENIKKWRRLDINQVSSTKGAF